MTGGGFDDRVKRVNRFEKLRSELKQFRDLARKRPEIELRPLEKWMIRELGVSRVTKKKGSHAVYNHPALRKSDSDPGNFQIALAHGKKVDLIHRKNFLDYVHKFLELIIKIMESEAAGAD